MSGDTQTRIEDNCGIYTKIGVTRPHNQAFGYPLVISLRHALSQTLILDTRATLYCGPVYDCTHAW